MLKRQKRNGLSRKQRRERDEFSAAIASVQKLRGAYPTIFDRSDPHYRMLAEEPADPQAGQVVEREHVGKEYATGPTTLLIHGQSALQENPDNLIQKKGLSIFDEMKQDAMVKAALFIKKFSRLSTQWTIRPASDSQQDKDLADFYEQQLENLPGTVIKMLLSQMTCLDYGYSIMEKNYYFVKDGEHRGKIGLSSVKSKKPHDFQFDQDEFSNVKGLKQSQTSGEDKLLPANKFITTTWMPEWENPYGTSDLKAAYVPWWQKDVIMRFQAIFLERYPAPVILGKYPPGTSQPDKDDLLEMLNDIQIHTEAIIPENIEIDTLKMDRSGSDLYTKAIDKRDTMIARALLIPELLGFSEKSSGSYALGKKQFDLFIGVLWHLGRTIEEILHEQLTVPFIGWNYDTKEFPTFQFEPLAEESSEVKAKIIATLSGAGFLDASDPDVMEWAADYMNILPQTKTKASEMAHEAMTFHTPFKFYSPEGRDFYEVEILENAARMELMEDALART